MLRERRLGLACQRHVDGTRTDAGASAVRREVGHVAFVVALHGDEIATGVLNRLRRHPLEDVALGAAFHRRAGVARHVARAAVQQTMVAPRSAGVDVVLLDQNAVNAAQREVARQRRTRDAAANDQDLSLDDRWEIQFH